MFIYVLTAEKKIISLQLVHFQSMSPHKIITRLWFKSYLKDRTQYVELGQCKSSVSSVHDGVPQGSILGPLLFSVYINDVPLFLKNVDVDLYADDTTLSVSGKDVYDVQSTLSYNLLLFQSWCKLIINLRSVKPCYYAPDKDVLQWNTLHSISRLVVTVLNMSKVTKY